ncbi:hypothetical protein FKM82_003568 [Ascaphus truei]
MPCVRSHSHRVPGNTLFILCRYLRVWGLFSLLSCTFGSQTERVPLDLSPGVEELEDFSEMEVQPSEAKDFEARGSRFSKSAEERQRMLVQRKEDLVQIARRRYLNGSPEEDVSASSEGGAYAGGVPTDSVTVRRRTLAAAAERRIQMLLSSP